ncbi:hypothetical protein C8J56DRAFT_1044033 [Mycena floridula]|nr:hypothetical protein C8J56DRAFT_1044033 [Mycena floridula]
MVDLNNHNHSVFVLSHPGQDSDSDDEEKDSELCDISDGHSIRWNVYEQAWSKCLTRIKSITEALQAPVLAEVLTTIESSYDKTLPGIPFVELPVITISNSSGNHEFLNDIIQHVEESAIRNNTKFVIQLHHADFTNVLTGMTALITGFVEKTPEWTKEKRKAIAGDYDIQLLLSWYLHQDNRELKLVVLLHDFEILNTHRLPVTFVLSLSSPESASSYLRSTFPRATMALLNVFSFVCPSGPQAFRDIVLQTFLDPTFSPDIMIGPETLGYLVDSFTRISSSMSSMISILQVAHLKHCTANPLTALAYETPSVNVLSKPDSALFTESAMFMLHAGSITNYQNPPNWAVQDRASLVHSIDEARASFMLRATELRLGCGILRYIDAFMMQTGRPQGLGWQSGQIHPRTLLLSLLAGEVKDFIQIAHTWIQQLEDEDLVLFIQELDEYLRALPRDVIEQVGEAWQPLMRYHADSANGNIPEQLADEFNDWLVMYLNSLWKPLDALPLAEVWYMGSSPFPEEYINPSIRASLLSGLLRPQLFIDEGTAKPSAADFALWELPDTSILFQRYLDSGKLINVYDWFESFQVALETQRQQLRDKTSAKGSPRKGKGKKHQEVDEEDEEKWKIQVQARFMRALQELDYLGFLKHTGRKAEHVQRTIFDIPDVME